MTAAGNIRKQWWWCQTVVSTNPECSASSVAVVLFACDGDNVLTTDLSGIVRRCADNVTVHHRCVVVAFLACTHNSTTLVIYIEIKNPFCTWSTLIQCLTEWKRSATQSPLYVHRINTRAATRFLPWLVCLRGTVLRIVSTIWTPPKLLSGAWLKHFTRY